MSNGGNLPYHLRPNKAVERLVFMDLLRRLDARFRVSQDYSYFGFGGPQMEDFRLIHSLFPEMKMISVEREPEVLRRQKFNLPNTNVKCKEKTSEEMINEVPRQKKVIVWLDYTTPSERSVQVEEFQNLLRRVDEFSLVKVTLNAASSTLGEQGGTSILQARKNRLMRDFGRFFANGLEEEEASRDKFPLTLLKILEAAGAEALRDKRNWRFVPLTSAVYADGQTMLTLTGMVGDKNRISRKLRGLRLNRWSFFRPTFDNPILIKVPELTLKERMYINELLPKCEENLDRIHRRLGFKFDPDLNESEETLKTYMFFQRHYPLFIKFNL